MNDSSVSFIKFQIMLIALISTIGFLSYVGFNYMVAKENGALILEIGSKKFPILQQITKIKNNVPFAKDALGKLIVLEDIFYIQDADRIDSQIKKSFAQVKSLEQSNFDEINKIQKQYHQWYTNGRSLSLQLMADTDAPGPDKNVITVLNLQYARLFEQLQILESFYINSYTQSLAQADSAQKQAISNGLLFGGILNIVLVIFAWTIANLVSKAVLKSNLVKDEFLATISHELRTPMNGVHGSLELLKIVAPNKGEIGDYIGTAYESTKSMMELIDNLLNYIEARSGNLKPGSYRFNLKLHLALHAHYYNNICQKKNMLFYFDLAAVPDADLIGDGRRLILLLKSLLDNAVKFTDKGSINLQITTRKVHQRIIFTFKVIDSGVGIEQKNMQEIYTSFRQVDGSFSRRHGGLGIGLATSAIIARLMKGNITFESTPGVGSTFCLEIPFDIAPKQKKSTKNTKSSAQKSPATKPTLSQPLDQQHAAYSGITTPHAEQNTITKPASEISAKSRFLVVEDNLVNQKVLRALLIKLGHEVDVAENGKVALNSLEENSFDCIFMDCQMPVMDGFDATRNIRKSSADFASIPIIAVTANAMSADREKCIDAGMNDYVHKPFKKETIRLMVDKYVCPDNNAH
ncbi:MAG: response regulator [Pseudomonadales bacterium]|nr:response regulator [Pseudomonadales bacterium]